MSGYYSPAIAILRCAHNVTQFERCPACEADREAAELAERRRINDPAQVIRDALARRRRWFDGCAFCPRAPDLVVQSIHEHDCPYIQAMYEAASRYAVHVVREIDPLTAERAFTSLTGSEGT